MVTVITGGASGIGYATAIRVLAAGGHVAIADLDGERAGEAAEKLGKNALAVQCDVTDEAAVKHAADEIESRAGRISALVTCAGAPQVPGGIADMDIQTFDRVTSSHWKGAFLSCRVFGERMIAAGGGVIVNLASVVGLCPGPTYAYAPAKAAVINMTSILAVEWAPKGVRVNAVAPGWTDTPFLTRATPGQQRNTDALAAANPRNELVQPDDVAAVVMFLLSAESQAITGTVIPVDHGYLAMRGWQPYK
ncbi:MAG: SDR family oxidoreductase [Aquisalimonadaceae bacterium]